MRLFTHNMLMCTVAACTQTAQRTTDGPKNFPLRIEPAPGGLARVESEFSAEFIARLVPKLDWRALAATAAALGVATLPPAPPPGFEGDEAFLRSVHALVMDVHVTEGALVCENCARRYPIVDSIPNMLLRDEEVTVA